MPLAGRREARADDVAPLIHGGDERAAAAQGRHLRRAPVPHPTLAAFELSRPGTSIARDLSPVVDGHHEGILSGEHTEILELAVVPQERASDVVRIRAGADDIATIIDVGGPAVAAVG